jgi:hypothetical protein
MNEFFMGKLYCIVHEQTALENNTMIGGCIVPLFLYFEMKIKFFSAFLPYVQTKVRRKYSKQKILSTKQLDF